MWIDWVFGALLTFIGAAMAAGNGTLNVQQGKPAGFPIAAAVFLFGLGLIVLAAGVAQAI